MPILLYVHKVFAQFALRNFLTYCIGNADFAYVPTDICTSMADLALALRMLVRDGLSVELTAVLQFIDTQG